ncbi:MAG: regulatory iron-sulfur-containing complex subunit RicT [Chloroflexota bacterium]|nr:regulatory iron-sulfur-containing complex subunit RicT [Chloroflexota bacterium]
MTNFIVGIHFQKAGKIYHFSANQSADLKAGDYVVVETSRGRQLGEIAQIPKNPRPPKHGSWKPVLRKATPRDLVLRQVWEKKEAEAVDACQNKLSELKLKGVKIVSAEFTLDGKRLTFLYTNEGKKVNINKLRNAMKKKYNVKVSMHKIGPRDAAKIIGGMGACGMEIRCCTSFMTQFNPISIKMAKSQGVSLSPSEITGMCGRLRCCLKHEHKFYVEAHKHLPKRNKRVSTPLGNGKVVKSNPIKDTVLVSLNDHITKEFPKDDVHVL